VLDLRQSFVIRVGKDDVIRHLNLSRRWTVSSCQHLKPTSIPALDIDAVHLVTSENNVERPFVVLVLRLDWNFSGQ
jgi:hypothetical protein